MVNKPTFLPQGTVENYPVHLFVPVTHDGRRKGFIDLGVKHANDLQGMPTEVIQRLAVELGIAIQQAAFIDKIQQHTTELETMVEERTSQLFASQQSEHEQRIFAEGMLAIVKNINQSLELEHVLKQVLINLENIVSYDGAQIVISDPDGDTTRVESRGDLQIEHDLQSNTSLVFENYPVYVKMARTREPILVREGASDLLFEGKQPEVALESYLGVPIQSGQQLFGFINLYGAQADAFESEDTNRLQAFAEHISIAVRNARSYLQSQELAAVEERQRLARNLHDAVSQLLFSLSIMAETLPNLARKKQYDRLASVSNKINLLASSAYAEMRLLLLELRPMSFENARLEDLLQQMVTALLGRHSSLSIQINVQAGGALSIAVKNNLYRIVQEALNNITKYAEAEQVAIQVWEEGETMHLTVEDNGTGFDIAQMSGGHGLKIMYERAAKIGASLTINSVIGQGTRLHMIYDRNMGNAST